MDRMRLGRARLLNLMNGIPFRIPLTRAIPEEDPDQNQWIADIEVLGRITARRALGLLPGSTQLQS